MYGVALSPNGKHAASGSADKTVRVWDLSSGECIVILEVSDDEEGCMKLQ